MPSERQSTVTLKQAEVTKESEIGQMAEERRDDDDGDVKEDEYEDDSDFANLIRIRSQDDGIFEPEDEDSDYDFPMPEVELLTPPPSRKRKQDIKTGNLDGYPELVQDPVDCEDYQDMSDGEFGNSRQFNVQSEYKKRDRLPLYLLNPDDYSHDPKRQAQIRRAIITYRHHQEKKEHIIGLTAENRSLRECLGMVKISLLNASSCGCEKNRNADYSEALEMDVPPYIPNRVNRSCARKAQQSSTNCSGNNEPSSTANVNFSSVKKEIDLENLSRPTPSRRFYTRANFLNKTPATQSPVTLLMNPLHQTPNTTSQVPSTVSKMSNGSLTTPQTNPYRVVTTVTPSCQKVVMSAIKLEPGINSSFSSVQGSAQPKVSDDAYSRSPATATTVSKIVFANKASTLSQSYKTASQLLFNAQVNVALKNSSTVATTTSALSNITASQLAFANRVKPASSLTFPTATTRTVPVINVRPIPAINVRPNQPINFRPIAPTNVRPIPRPPAPVTFRPVQPNNSRSPHPINFRPTQTSSNLRPNLRPASTTNARPTPGTVLIPNGGGQVVITVTGDGALYVKPIDSSVPHLRPIAPKPAPGVNAGTSAKEKDRIQSEEMWRKFDEQGSVNGNGKVSVNAGTSFSPRTRKQALDDRNCAYIERRGNKRVLKAGGGEIELNKYADIVFEEAD